MIRDFVTGDLKQCSEVFAETYNGSPWFNNWTSDSAKEYLLELTSNKRFFGYVVLKNETIVGACFCHLKKWWNGDEIFIDEFFISPSKQRQGYGHMLMQALKQYGNQKAIENMSLITDKRKPAFDFYGKAGFNELENLAYMHKKID